MSKFDHEYMHENAIVHDHGEAHQRHIHTLEETKAVVNRLARAIGHLEHVKMLVEEGRDCSEVLIQLSAVRSALNHAGLMILQNHIEHCIVDSVKTGDMTAVNELNKAVARYLK